MFGRRSILKTALATVAGTALPQGRRAVAALPADTRRPPVEVFDARIMDDEYWREKKDRALAKLYRRAIDHGARISSPLADDGATFVIPGRFGVVYIDDPDRRYLSLIGEGIDDGILLMIFNMLAMQLGGRG